jgi:hypothetical protein
MLEFLAEVLVMASRSSGRADVADVADESLRRAR